MEHIHHLLHPLEETLHLVPFLFLTYLLMELLEHQAGERTKQMVKKAGMAGPFVGGLLGAFPQCGFSAAASNLYAGRVISVGTLIAIYLSTSDEMLPILISESVPMSSIVKILAVKILIGMVTGYALEFVRMLRHKAIPDMDIRTLCENENCHCDTPAKKERTEKVKKISVKEIEHHHVHTESTSFVIFRSALIHTIKIAAFIALVTIALHLVIDHGGEDVLKTILIDTPVLGQLLTGLIGLIPNCTGSVVITKLYLEGILTAGAMMSGLLVSAGVGVVVLLRMNRKHMKKNLAIIGVLYACGVCWGILIDLLGIVF